MRQGTVQPALRWLDQRFLKQNVSALVANCLIGKRYCKETPMPERTFKATLERPDIPGSWTYLDIPFDVEQVFGHKGQVKVKGTINGHPYRSSAMPKGDGSHFLVVNKNIRDGINVTQGTTVQVVMDLDTDPRTVDVPSDFQQALDKRRKAKAIFEKFSYSRQNEYVTWIESAKTNKTRMNRIQSAVGRLARGLGLKDQRH